MEYNGIVNAVLKIADKVCQKYHSRVGKKKPRYKMAEVNLCAKVLERKDLRKYWLTN